MSDSMYTYGRNYSTRSRTDVKRVKRFTVESSLVQHVRIHTGEKLNVT
jgi:hypothetical protein